MPRDPWTIVLEELPTGCVVCTSHRPMPTGRVQLNRGGRMVLLSHLLWEEQNGPIPDGLILRHSCDNPPCLNLDHLLLGTQKDNVRDMYERGRENPVSGASHGRARFTEADILAIRRSRELGKVLAERYGTTIKYISRIRTGTTWRHLNAA